MEFVTISEVEFSPDTTLLDSAEWSVYVRVYVPACAFSPRIVLVTAELFHEALAAVSTCLPLSSLKYVSPLLKIAPPFSVAVLLVRVDLAIVIGAVLVALFPSA